jgi:hypothetical protein
MIEGNALQVVILSFSILGVILLLMAIMLFNRWFSRHDTCPSPYTATPLRRASTLSYSAMVKVLRYLADLRQYDNRIFLFRKASFCRETERIFQNSVTWYDAIRVDWNFLTDRYPGNWVSWGSLADGQKAEIYYAHDSLEGYQVEFSSRNPAPRQIEPEFVYMKPGPLYVDIDTKVLLGWKLIPDSDLEVLIVQKPRPKPIYPNFQQNRTETK